MPTGQQQGGGSLLIVLIALAIVAYLARDALLSVFGSLTTRTAASSDARSPPTARPATDASAGVPTLEAPVQRARAVVDVVRGEQE